MENSNETMSAGSQQTKSTKKPRRPLTAYNYFFHVERQKIQARIFQMTGQRPGYTQISRLVGAKWKKIDPEKKAHYEALAMKDKRRYALELVKMKEQEGTQTESITSFHQSSYKENTDFPPLALDEPIKNKSQEKVAPGVDPNSLSYQIMLRQSLTENKMSETDFLNNSNPELTAQIIRLSIMMIDYVKQVAPDRLARRSDYTAPSTQNGLMSSTARNVENSFEAGHGLSLSHS